MHTHGEPQKSWNTRWSPGGQSGFCRRVLQQTVMPVLAVPCTPAIPGHLCQLNLSGKFRTTSISGKTLWDYTDRSSPTMKPFIGSPQPRTICTGVLCLFSNSLEQLLFPATWLQENWSTRISVVPCVYINSKKAETALWLIIFAF